jgi:hypothetical protein
MSRKKKTVEIWRGPVSEIADGKVPNLPEHLIERAKTIAAHAKNKSVRVIETSKGLQLVPLAVGAVVAVRNHSERPDRTSKLFPY